MIGVISAADIGRARAALVDVVNAVVALHKEGGELVGPCPFHRERTPSFKVNETKGFGHCFGCGWHGDAIAFAQDMQGLSFIEAVAYILGGKHGASSSRRPATSTSRSSTSRSSTERSDANRRLAREMWASASSAAIIAGTYFPARAITIPIPPTIREHGSLKHTPTGLVLPAIVAAVQGPDGRVRAIQRIFLTQDYSRKAGVQKPKMALGRLTGGAVRLGPMAARIGLSEGIEDGLTVMRAEPGLPVWACLGTSGLRSVVLPPLPLAAEVVILADGDEAGETAAQAAARRFIAEGRRVSIARPSRGCDFNDLAAA